MNNKRISARERGLIKGGLRRVFSRSDLRREALLSAKVTHSDPKRPRVKTWYACAECKKPYPQHQLQLDHKIPIVPIDSTLEDMNWDTLINNLWCSADNLQILCLTCHKKKCKTERDQRKQFKKGTK